MISDQLLAVVRCPECKSTLAGAAKGGEFRCTGCGRVYQAPAGEYLDLRPADRFAEQTKYLDEALHADARHERVSPPLLGSKIRNDMLRKFLRPSAGDRVVDLGCGSGRALLWNRDLGADAIGIDISPFFSQEARHEMPLLLGVNEGRAAAEATRPRTRAKVLLRLTKLLNDHAMPPLGARPRPASADRAGPQVQGARPASAGVLTSPIRPGWPRSQQCVIGLSSGLLGGS